jgi:HK97 gp10 family phage protein
MPIDVRMNFDALDKWIGRSPQKADQAVQDACDIIIADIQGSWSGNSPSSPGNPPAVVTGALDESIEKQKLAGGNTPKYQIIPVTYYWLFLEDGTINMAARPFLYPAMRRNRAMLAGVFKVHFGSL